MATKICKAVLNLSPTDWEGIFNQGGAFISHLYVETTIYVTPIITLADFQVMVTDAGNAITAAIKGDDVQIAYRKDRCDILNYAMKEKMIPYINGLWAGNRTNLEKSGAKVSADPTPVPAPDQQNISRIVKGPDPGSIKVYPVRGVNSALKKRSRTLYRIIMFEKEDDAKGSEVGSSYDSTNLIGREIPVSVYRYYGISAQNTGGTSPLSSKVKFFLSI